MYVRLGYRLAPVPLGDKGPVLKEWQKVVIDEGNLGQYFPAESNVGVLLGVPPHYLVDIDLDTPEAVRLASVFLPETTLKWGHETNPLSHWGYRVDQSAKSKRFHLKGEGSQMLLLEIRAKGCQTLLPPSVHPEGDEYQGDMSNVPEFIEWNLLSERVHLLAAAVIASLSWPSGVSGNRQNLALAYAGALLRLGWSSGDADLFVGSAAEVAGDEEYAQRRIAEYTKSRLSNGDSVFGMSTVAEIIGEDVAKQIGRLLDKGTGNVFEGNQTGKEKGAKPSDGLQGRAVLRKNPEPWPEPVDGKGLLDDIANTIGRFVILPEHGPEALALWIVSAWALNSWDVFARLAIVSPEKRCGKSRTLELLQGLSPRPILACSVSPAALFRTVEAMKDNPPTFLIDEVDAIFSKNGNEEMRQMLNSSHMRSNANVFRLVGDKYDPREFSTWCPIALASIKDLPSTLMDRSIVIRMQRKLSNVKVLRMREAKELCQSLARMAFRWVGDNQQELGKLDPLLPVKLNDRAQDNWRPLISVADLAGGEWPNRAREAAIFLSGESVESDGFGVMVLLDLESLFASKGKPAWLSTESLCNELSGISERPWGDIKGKAIAPRYLAKLLKPFGIHSAQKRMDDSVTRGYFGVDIWDAVQRYGATNEGHSDAIHATSQKEDSEAIDTFGSLGRDIPEEGDIENPEITPVADVAGGGWVADNTSVPMDGQESTEVES
jgi:hypothetical protein